MANAAEERKFSKWFFERGALARDGWEGVVDGHLPGWEHTGLRVAALSPGDSVACDLTGVERIVIPLSGSFTVHHSERGEVTVTDLDGRPNVFVGPSDVLYLSSDSTCVITGDGRVAVAECPTSLVHPTRHIRADEVPVELRGAGQSSRQVHNFGTPDALEAGRFIVCEVITPHGNWSSYPPHKHDEFVPGTESNLEEIYYFEAAPVAGAGAPDPSKAFGLFSAYSSPAGELEIDAQVRSGDIALVPYGYHGPAVAAPGYDLYYLNVMAGPGAERSWNITDDPDHAWVRGLWDSETIDSRLPYKADEPVRTLGAS